MAEHHVARLLEKLLAEGSETDWLELKSNNDNPKLMGENISALSNGACLAERKSGYLVYGVTDTFEIVGTVFRPSEYRKGNEPILNWLMNRLSPKIGLRFHEVAKDGKSVVIIQIDAATTTPIAFDKEAWIRIGKTTRKLNEFPEIARKIWTKDNKTQFETDIAKRDVTGNQVMRTLDYESFFKLSERQPPNFGDDVLNELIEAKHIVGTEHGLYDITNLGAMLLAIELKEFESLARKAVRVVSYDGPDRRSGSTEQPGKKGYAAGFVGLIAFIMSRLGSEQVRGALRQTVYAYPELAVRELAAYALIHQDFAATGTGPLIEIFSNRLEITNPGQSLVKMDRIIDSMPRSRNVALAHAMRLFGICEELGGGVEKAVAEIESQLLPAPIFEQGSDFVRVTLLGKRPLKQMTRDDRVRACYQHCVLRYKAKNPMSNGSFRERIGIEGKNYSMAHRIISDARDDGLIKVQDSGSTSRKFTRYLPTWA